MAHPNQELISIPVEQLREVAALGTTLYLAASRLLREAGQPIHPRTKPPSMPDNVLDLDACRARSGSTA